MSTPIFVDWCKMGRTRTPDQFGPLMTYYRQKIDYKVHMLERDVRGAKVMQSKQLQ